MPSLEVSIFFACFPIFPLAPFALFPSPSKNIGAKVARSPKDPPNPLPERPLIMELIPPTIVEMMFAKIVRVGSASINAIRIALNNSKILEISFSIESPNFKKLLSFFTMLSPNASKFFLSPPPIALIIPPRNLLMILLAALNLCRYALKEPKADLTFSQNDANDLKKPSCAGTYSRINFTENRDIASIPSTNFSSRPPVAYSESRGLSAVRVRTMMRRISSNAYWTGSIN